jgi:hypothetical protein
MPEGLVGLRNDCTVGGDSEASEAGGEVFTYHSLLQLPWSYSMPPTIVAGVPHWLLGRSLFLVQGCRVRLERRSGKVGESSQLVGAVLSNLACDGAAWPYGSCSVHLFLPQLENGIPFKGLSCYAISTACQPLAENGDIALQPLMWGMLREPTKGNPGQCGFPTEEVARPLEGRWYWRLRSYASNPANAHQTISNTELVSQSMPCYKRIWDAQSHAFQKPMKGLSLASRRMRLTITTIRNQEPLAMQSLPTPSSSQGKIAYSRVSWR